MVFERGFDVQQVDKVSGWFGTVRSSAATEPVTIAAAVSSGFSFGGGGLPLEPPAISRSAVRLVALAGTTTVNQCFHRGRSTSAASRQRCDVSSSTCTVQSLAGTVWIGE